MSNKPYPGHPPSYRVIPKVGDYTRTCLVIELLSQDALDDVQMAQICERLEATIDKTCLASVEHFDVVMPNRFDRLLRGGLRLP